MNQPAVKLRDKRKPGHCWQDNELYDCFQPVIGALAVGVYVRLTRECVGTTVKGVSLRDLAAMCGLSKSAVQRAFAVMETVGIVVATRSSAHRSPEYELADLKELAVGYDAEFDPLRYSYILKPDMLAKLRAKVAELERRLQGPRVPQRDTEARVGTVAGVPQNAVGVPQDAIGVPQTGKNCEGNRLYKNTRIQKDTTPLPPSKNEGGLEKEMEAADAGDRYDESADGSDGDRDRLGSEPGADAQRGRGPVAVAAAGATRRLPGEQRGSGLDAPVSAVGSGVGELAAAERVMQACGWVNRRLRPMIAEAIVLAMARGDPAAQTERRMVAMWQDLQRANCDGLLRYGISPRKFIAEAHWRTDAMWPYDREGLRNAQQAALGSRRTG